VLWVVAGRVDDEVDLEELELTGVPEWALRSCRKLRQPF
jgi:hypothetical protein